jgi:D-tagatose-1,6-bisphosphate aldolase subunit GatZ/KbaZ
MRLADDSKEEMLSTDVIARRGITLLQVCEDAYQERLKTVPDSLQPVYIIGSEVPIPGGAQEEEGIEVTKAADFKNTVEVYRKHMEAKGLLDVWRRILAVVVQPGVEFGDASVHEYDRLKAQSLIASLDTVSGLVFEGHSTDYQTRFGLKEMVEDGIAILKVGPALTFALREGLYALAHMEKAFVNEEAQSKFMEVLEDVMLENPNNWKKHYHGSEQELAFKRHYSFSDRSRYYMPDARIEAALMKMMGNLQDIPLSLLSQYMPIQYRKVREGRLKKDPELLAQDVVHELLKDYRYAVEGVY